MKTANRGKSSNSMCNIGMAGAGVENLGNDPCLEQEECAHRIMFGSNLQLQIHNQLRKAEPFAILAKSPAVDAALQKKQHGNQGWNLDESR